jgi:hypothetical protein
MFYNKAFFTHSCLPIYVPVQILSVSFQVSILGFLLVLLSFILLHVLLLHIHFSFLAQTTVIFSSVSFSLFVMNHLQPFWMLPSFYSVSLCSVI